MKRVAISTLGCKTNQFESAAMIEQLQKAGYCVVPFSQQADIYIVNSCTVTARTDAETRRHIRRARRLNPAARIIATGCYAQVAPGELEAMPELDCVLGNREKQDIAGLLETSGHQVSDITEDQASEGLKLSSFAEHTRAFLQVQNGCNAFCTYCIVPYARGRSRSVSSNEVLEEIRSLAANGFQEVVLTGIHLGAYGLDLTPRDSLTELVGQIDTQRLVPRLRIGSIEPNEVSDELLALMASSSTICPHLHLPLQSGCDTVLTRMGRGYTTDYFKSIVDKVARLLPEAFIGADLIAGFPGETEAEFNTTVQLLQALPLSDLHVFPYSRRPGTAAAGMSGHLPAQVITERAARLREIAALKKRMFLERFVGQKLQVLIQSCNPISSLCQGISRNYLAISCAGSPAWLNRELLVTVTGSTGQTLTAEIKGESS